MTEAAYRKVRAKMLEEMLALRHRLIDAAVLAQINREIEEVDIKIEEKDEKIKEKNILIKEKDIAIKAQVNKLHRIIIRLYTENEKSIADIADFVEMPLAKIEAIISNYKSKN
jgi:hypothetical protein